MTEFKIGDRVSHNVHGTGVVRYGPFTSAFGPCPDVYLVEFDKGHVSKEGRFLTPVPDFAPGDHVQVVSGGDTAAVLAGPFNDGDVWYVIRQESGTEVAELAKNLKPADAPQDPNQYTYRGVTYDLSDEYVDREEDTWRFSGESDSYGVPYMRLGGMVRRLNDVVNTWGPLTRV